MTAHTAAQTARDTACPRCWRELSGGPGGPCPICTSGEVDTAQARAILAADPLAAMDYATAYRVIFRTDLQDRCRDLIASYGEAAGKVFEDGGVCWELGQYGHTPLSLLAVLDRI